ncbi:uncharacterized protein LOC143882738 [Tasmannia lanceolata]|uniref:uncharacterized protein LOC143882738 n=1 Tax=Tasmannia lanceolata TaxID=3420 RepID=UPI004064BC87
MLEIEDPNPDLIICPSFSRYSAVRFGEIAAEIIREEEKSGAGDPGDQRREEAEDDDFEFAFSRHPDTSPISADEIFSNGQIRPIFPIFNRDLLLPDEKQPENNQASIRLPLRKLLSEERDRPFSSSSSSESNELVGLPADSYCVWTPRSVPPSPARCKKSNSTGSSKRWRFRDLLHRSSSDGKETFVFLSSPAPATASKKDSKLEIPKARRNSGENKLAGKGKAGETASAHEMHYVRNRAIKEGDRRRSFLPYRQDIVGFFANVNGLSKSLHPF